MNVLNLNSEFVPPGHFYSVVPSAEDRQKYIDTNYEYKTELPGIESNLKNQIKLLEVFKSYFDTCEFPDTKKDGFRYYFNNPAYSYGDALVLNAFIRHYKPARIIEIGSGYSSAAILDTRDSSKINNLDLTFIEPYPDLLISLMSDEDKKSTKLVPTGVQKVDIDIFKKLEANDILFVDSTHVSKLGSDVNRIFFEIFPILKPGVLIHIHDIFWPFEYPKAWVEEGRAWNELYLLRSLLLFTNGYEIMFFSNYLWQTQEEWFRLHAKPYCNNPGGNFWMRKIK